MVQSVYSDAQERMEKAVSALKRDLATLRAGRATPSLLDKIVVDYYGSSMPINQLANVSTPEPRLLVIQPWDKNAVAEVERAILKSDLGLTPVSDGSIIRLAIPQLTEERRKELVKVSKKKAEDGRVSIRNIRRDANEDLKRLEKDNEITEDELHKAQDDIQKLTDKFIAEADSVLDAKEKEIMEV
ncbi:ribosome recycling factor [Dethiobacter alkaliphilus]|uniref:Ribosome-recycling factor n=1 Tax=Dethiobacter alkaliphilus AHT 1 TaxID=555088 RepID=C0GIU5_DETAL|nr:ribosome recycling factor [Dethiobacter alkaliphilus]EEG76759.1 ribosome recycling factor [Dethiobacter alkaliphilus AHT 1]MCW3490856.1 ribosome recycling factor [Dethiobacter alkaliphilus]